MKYNFISIMFLFVSVLFFQFSSNIYSQSKENTKRSKAAISANQICPILNGEKIPNVQVRNIDGNELSLQELVIGKKTVLIFYRGGWCPYCNTQLLELKDTYKELKDMGYQLLAISPDSPEELQKSREKHNIDFSIYSDSYANVIKAFGIAFQVDKETLKQYKSYNIDLERSSGGYNHNLLPVPAVYFVSKKGNIQSQFVYPDYRIRMKGELIIATAKSY